eukprot:TRINITY_DN15573_c0_g3_i1.p1 TRINITY_DN15573_c0_g3~~TRINITY_DN15573_c0_g3_i1.p1  ORF type:complete len:622 (+),score=95.89 TRINITY_DN15573_c0_g3_i1:79-1944(+)
MAYAAIPYGGYGGEDLVALYERLQAERDCWLLSSILSEGDPAFDGPISAPHPGAQHQWQQQGWRPAATSHFGSAHAELEQQFRDDCALNRALSPDPLDFERFHMNVECGSVPAATATQTRTDAIAQVGVDFAEALVHAPADPANANVDVLVHADAPTDDVLHRCITSIPLCDDIAELLEKWLSPANKASGCRWIFVGPRWPWFAAGMSASEVEALARTGAPRAHSRLPRLLNNVGSDWSRSGEAAAIERVVRAGGLVLLAVRADALAQWQESGTLAPARYEPARRSREMDVSMQANIAIEMRSISQMQYLEDALSDDFFLTRDVVLRHGVVLQRGWRLLTRTHAMELMSPSGLRKLQLPTTLQFDPSPGVPVAVAPPLPSASPTADECSVPVATALRWPPTKGTRVRWAICDSGSASIQDTGTVLAVEPPQQVLVRWDKDQITELIPADELEEFDETASFLERVRKFRNHWRGSVSSSGDSCSKVLPEQSKRTLSEPASESWCFVLVSGAADTELSGCVETRQVGVLFSERCIDSGNSGVKLIESNPFLVPAAVLRLGAKPSDGGSAAALILLPTDNAYDHVAKRPPQTACSKAESISPRGKLRRACHDSSVRKSWSQRRI